jgi:hypothetical protein
MRHSGQVPPQAVRTGTSSTLRLGEKLMKTPRKMITSAILAVAFLSAGAFAQSADTMPSQKNITVIAKIADESFAS